MIVPSIVLFIVVIMNIDSLLFWKWDWASWVAFLILSPLGLGICFGIFLQPFYILIYEDVIVFKNYCIPFVNISYLFSDMSKVEIDFTKNPRCFVRFFRVASNKWTVPLGLDGLETSDYDRFTEIFINKGIEVTQVR